MGLLLMDHHVWAQLRGPSLREGSVTYGKAFINEDLVWPWRLVSVIPVLRKQRLEDHSTTQ